MRNVFISYRRGDSAPYAGRICDQLGAALGENHVFMDVEDIAPGTDFADAIEQTVGACDVLIAVIGPRWLESLQSRAGVHDFVEHEIAAALRRKVTVVPVLVGGASMPSESDLPPELAALSRRQALSLRDDDFRDDVSHLVRSLTGKKTTSAFTTRLIWSIIATGIIVSLIGTGVFLYLSRERGSINGTWLARLQRPGQRPYSIRLQLEAHGKDLTGEVTYPTGSGSVQGGTIYNGKIAFFTKHIPQFESEPATILISGQMKGREIELTVTTPDGTVTRGVARKTD